ncbi:MAG: PAS domain S-box protein [Melioribacteraceae bacterium]
MEKNAGKVIINKKNILLLVIALIGLHSVGAYLYYSFEEKSIKDDKHNEIRVISELKISQLTQWLRERRGDANTLSKSHFFVKSIEQFLGHNQSILLKNEIKNRITLYKDNYHYEDVFVVSAEGKTLIGTSGNNKPYTQTTLQDIKEVFSSRRIVFSDLYENLESKKIEYDIIAPVMNEKSKVIAAIIFRIDPVDYLFPLIQTWPIPSKTSETLIIRKEGNWVLFLNEIRHRKNSALKFKISLDQKEVPAVQAVLGRKGIFEGKDYRGIDVLSYLSEVPESPWFMVAKVDKSEIYSELNNKAISIAIFTLLLIFLSGAGLAWIYLSRQRNIYKELLDKGNELWKSQEEFKTILYSIGDGVITTDRNGLVVQLNPVAEQLIGWTENEAKHQPLERVFQIIGEESRSKVESPVSRVLREGKTVGLANHTVLISKNGTEIPIADSGAPIKNENGDITGVVLVFRDQTEERRTEKIINTRLALAEYSRIHSLQEFLQKTLDEVCYTTNSPIGFYHFVEDDQVTISLQAWSTKTLKEYCTAEGGGLHYNIDKAGIWVECVYTKKPVVHNDYASLANKKGLPDGHAPLIRELVVPIIRNGKVVAILGVGNKANEYTERDVETVSFLADVAWELVATMKIEQSLRQSEEFNRTVMDNLPVGIAVNTIDPTIQFSYINDNFTKFYCTTREAISEPDNFWDAVYEDPVYREQIKKKILDDCATGVPERMIWEDIPITRQGKETRFISARNIELPEKKLMISTVWDVTERKLVEKSLKESEEKYRVLFEGAGEGILVADVEEKVFKYANPAICQMLGYTEAEIIKLGVLDIHPKESLQMVLQEFEAQSLTKKTVASNIPCLRKDGSLFYADISARPAIIEGRIMNIGLFTDITERKRVEEKIREKDIQFRKLSANLPDLIFQFTRKPDGTYCVPIASEGIKNIFGCLPEDVVDDFTPIGKVIYPEDVEKVINEIEYSAKHLTFFTCEFRVQIPGKEVQWIFSRSSPEKLPDGSITWYGFNADITERKLAEEKNTKLNELLYHLISSIKELSSAHDLKTIQQIIATSARKLTGADGATIVYKEGDFCYYADEDAIEPLWKGKRFPLTSCISGWVMLNKTYAVIEDIYADNRIPIEAYVPTFVKSLAMVPIIINEPLGAIGNYWATNYKPTEIEIQLLQTLADAAGRAIENVNLYEELEKRVKDRTAQLEASVKELEAFSYTVSHDLRAPLRAMDGFTKILIEDYSASLDTEALRLLNIITTNSKKMGNLVDDLLAFSRLGRQEMKYSEIDMRALAISVYQELVTDTEKNRIQFHIENIPTAYGDYNMIHQVWVNLIGNAIKYSRLSENPTIEIGSTQEGEEVIYFIKDNGVGFDMAYYNKLFGVFQRLHSSKDFEGTGVGLAIIQRIIQRQSGRVWANGKINEGATFFFTLPASSEN